RLRIFVGWVEERNPTFSFSLLGFAYAQPNLHIFIFSLNRTVLHFAVVYVGIFSHIFDCPTSLCCKFSNL
ncbi:hypothetical protein LC605_31465, partial [Nostoc sp. CHAB 5836]|uniref:hypothetical protein n=1 Tax=Nostoc sp. CHAB 5836 TaxID=2780404 RepID=UPI001E412A26